MTPEQRRTIYGLLNDVLPPMKELWGMYSLWGKGDRFSDGFIPFTGVVVMIERRIAAIQQEMDDAASDV